jgi:hypothetical protein
MERKNAIDKVGPILQAGDVTSALLTAIRELNPDTVVQSRGSYWRVLAPGRCVLTREAAERSLGRSFMLPGDLEAVMPSFKGALSITDDEAVWEYRDRQ